MILQIGLRTSTSNMEWTQYFLQIAETVKLKSKDQRTQIGAVIVGEDNEIVSTGYNSFPRGINDDIQERQERPEKYYWVVHAEMNAILNAARIGVSTKDCTMYLTCGVPCSDCCRGIINAGIKRIFVKREDTTRNREHWDAHAARSRVMFEESGVEVLFYE
jgi:dCMP deaminase